MKLLLRLLLAIPLLWLAGFVWFLLSLPAGVEAEVETDAIVVLTGGPGRVAHGVELLQEGYGERLLVSGVDPTVRPIELAEELGVDEALFTCCIDLGKQAENTVGNAFEIGAWVRRNGYTSLRVVTAADHMPRALHEIERELGPSVALVADPVAPKWGLSALATEFSKYTVRSLQMLVGRG